MSDLRTHLRSAARSRLGTMMSRPLIVLAAAAALVACAGAQAANLEAGRAKAKEVCAACHGENGNKPLQPEYPVLAGQHEDYLIHALRDYKTGKRKNAIMGGMAQPLSNKEIEDVAAWFASQPTPLHVIEK